jgi:hypothetical protein
MPSVKRLVSLLLKVVLGAAIVLLSLAVLERQSGKRRLAYTLAAIERAGDTLSISALRPPTIAEQSNAWAALLPHTNRLATVPDALREPPPLWSWDGDGTLLPLGSRTNETAGANTVDSLRQGLATAPDLRERIHDAVARPDFDARFPYSQGFFELPGDTTVLVSAGRWLYAEACVGLIDRDAAAFRRALNSMLRLLRHQGRQPLLIGQLTRHSLVLRALGLTAHGLRDPRILSQADLGELRDAWAGFGVLEDFEHALRMERAVARQHFQILATNRVRRAEAIGWADESRRIMDLEEEHALQRAWRTFVQEPLWPWLWTDHDLAWSLTQWNHRIAAARRASTSSWNDAAFDISALDVRSGFLEDVPMEGVQGPGFADRIRCRFSLGGPHLFPDHPHFRIAYRAETARRLAVAALRVYCFQREHGHWPERLAEACTATPEVEGPIDPMSGQPLRYRRLSGDAEFLLYSVGTDGKDDGGSVEVEDEDEPYRTPFDGKDWVWPRLIE